MNDHLEGSADPIRRRPNAAEALYATGHRLLSSNRFADAACVYRVMLTCAPQDERGWLALGACHEGLRQHDLALQLYATGRALSRGGGRCDLARARLFRALGRVEQAGEAMRRAHRRAMTTDDQELLALLHAEEGLS
jgi:tetratricopeptide (TPR) repeat protein